MSILSIFHRSPINNPPDSFLFSRTTILWGVVLLSGLILLIGRYEWSERIYPYSFRAYLSSAYLFLLFLPTSYYTLSHFLPQQRLVLVITVMIAFILTLPYQWLGLNIYTYTTQVYSHGKTVVPPDWFPEALSHYRAFPGESWLFLGLILLGLGIAWLRWKPQQSLAANRNLLIFIGLYLLILLETWLHLSLRSPNNYTTYFVPGRLNSIEYSDPWYIVYLFSNLTGATNADYPVWRDLEILFIGVPENNLFTMLIRRPFLAYLTAQFTYFFNPFYVYLVFNTIIWFTASVCAYLFTRTAWNERTALITAFLIATGSGFICMANQLSSYLTAYALVIILIYLFDVLLIKPQLLTDKNPVKFGLILGLAALVYDLFPFYLFFLLYTMLRKAQWWPVIKALALSLVIYASFLLLQSYILRLPIDHANDQYITKTLNNILDLVIDLQFKQLYILTVTGISLYMKNLNLAFFLLPIILAVLGGYYCRNRTQFLTAMALLVPSLAALLFLHLGAVPFRNIYLAELPRLFYVAYPAVYILAAVALDKIAHWKPFYTYSLMATIWGLNNIDVLGFPWLYYGFCYSFPLRNN